MSSSSILLANRIFSISSKHCLPYTSTNFTNPCKLKHEIEFGKNYKFYDVSKDSFCNELYVTNMPKYLTELNLPYFSDMTSNPKTSYK